MPTILIADDDHTLTAMLRQTLADEGYRVLTVADGKEALAQAQAHRPDLVVLDWMMPGPSGLDVARRLRAAEGMPILMLTARDAIEDRVEGLDGGADDYLVKPFAPAELLARIRSVLRRATDDGGEKPLRYTDLVLDPTTRETRRGDRAFTLSPKEFDLLSYLLHHPRQVLPRERILEEVWGYVWAGDTSTVTVHVRRLRAKLEEDPAQPRRLVTVWGIGYRFDR